MKAATATTFYDPICGMFIDPATAAATSQYEGQTFYFCMPSCKAEFDQAPQKFAPLSREQTADTSCCSTAHNCCTTD